MAVRALCRQRLGPRKVDGPPPSWDDRSLDVRPNVARWIPARCRGGSEEGHLSVTRLTRSRKPKGNRAWREKRGSAKARRVVVPADRRDTVKARLLESQYPVAVSGPSLPRMSATPPHRCLGPGATKSSGGGTMGNDPIQGHERDTDLALTSNEQEVGDCLRGATPTATEAP